MLNFIKFVLKKIIESKRVPKFIREIAGRLSLKFIRGIMPYLFGAVVEHAERSKSAVVKRELSKVVGYQTADHLSDRQKVAINVQMKTQNHDCKTGKCVLTLTGEGCSPFETIRCKTCNTNICSLTVCYFTENFHKKYIEK